MWLFAWLLVITAAPRLTLTEQESVSLRSRRDAGEKRVVCYYTNWSVYRPGTAKFNPQNINPYLCTHLIYAFGGLSKDNSLKPFDKYQDIEQGGYAKFNGLKTYNKNLKTLVAIGGWNEGSARFSPLVADSDRRKELVRNAIKFLRQNHFDGLDLDWEYPAFRDGGKPRDRENYAKFVQELREEFDRESSKTGRTRLLLTMAVPAGIEYIDKGYDVPKLNEYLDWFNILSYDYHSAFEPAVDHHAPLLPLEPDDEYNFGSQLNIDATVKHYLKLGADRNKLVIGIPTYGRSYTLFNPEATDIGSAADGPGEQGDATREKGYLAYYEICEKVKDEKWTIVNPHPEAMGPYAYKDNQWVGYDDEAIVKAKSKYVNENDLGGIMFWSIDDDDFRGKCHGKPYPLIEAAKEALFASSNELAPGEPDRSERERGSGTTKNRKTKLKTKTTTEAAKTTRTTPLYSTTTPQPPTTPDAGSDFVCKDEGFFPHPRDCKKYFWCLDSGPSSLGIVAHQFTCPSGLVFNQVSDSCDYARNVICKTKAEITTTTAKPISSTTTVKTTEKTKLVITAAPPRHKTTTTTTTEAPEEYEEYDEEEEDPGAIKELIGLIKRLGGVEQLEKQLAAQEGSKTGIKPSLYSKVLSGRAGNKFRGAQEETSTSKYQSLFRNRPAGPQSSGVDTEKGSAKQNEKPQYTTIFRNRATNKRPAEEQADDEGEEAEEEGTVEAPKNKKRRPSGSSDKEYVSLQRNNARNGDEHTTVKYKSILRTRSTTEAPQEDTEEVEEEAEEEVPTKEIIEKPKKYSAVYRENTRQRYEEEPEEEKEKVSAVRPQYVTLTRGKVSQQSGESEPPISRAPVNIVNNARYVELRRTTPQTAAPENVNSVNSPAYVEPSANVSKQEVSSSTTETISSKTPHYSTIHRTQESISRNKLEETEPEPTMSPESNKSLNYQNFEREPSSTKTPNEEENSNFVQRRNDGTTEIIRRRTRPPVLTTKSYTDAISKANYQTTEGPKILNEASKRFRNRPNLENTRTVRLSTTTSTEAPVSEPKKRYQFAPRVKPTISPIVPSQSTFTIVVPETTISLEETTTPINSIEITTEEVLTPRNGLPPTAFQKIRTTTTPRVDLTTSTVTRVVTSITESSFTERQKLTVTKKSTLVNKAIKSTTEKPVTESIQPFVRSTRPYNSRRIQKTTTTTTTVLPELPQGRSKVSRFRSRSTTISPVETSTEERRFVPKRGRSRGISKFGDSLENTTPTTTTSTQKSEPFRRRVISRRVKRPKVDLDTDQSGSFYDDNDDDLDSKFILGESIKKTSAKDKLVAEVLFATVPSVEAEEKSAIIKTNSQETVKPVASRVFRGKKKAQDSITENVPEDYRKKIQRIVERKRPNVRVRSQEVSSVTDSNKTDEETPQDLAPETGLEQKPQRPETQPSTSTQATVPRRSSQDYLTNLRSRSRTSTSTTTTPSTPQRRPGVNLDRRRKFRPDRTTSKPDNSQDSTSTAPRSIRRRTRPTTTSTTTTTTTEPITSIESAEVKELEADIPELANPAVVAIHNLATLAPAPVRELPNPYSPSAVTISPRPSVPSFRDSTLLTNSPRPATQIFSNASPFTNTPRPSPPPFLDTSLLTHSSRFSTPAFQEVSQALHPSTRIATSYTDFRQSSGQQNSLSTRIFTPTTDQVVTQEVQDTPSTRSEVIIAPRRYQTTASPPTSRVPTQRKLKPFSKVPKAEAAQTATKPEKFSSKDYEYYDDADALADVSVPASALKVKVHSDGYIECLDQGNFPHPFSCKKFISCAKMENSDLLGWEYTCPKHLSFDPVGGICNWSAGLGCQH